MSRSIGSPMNERVFLKEQLAQPDPPPHLEAAIQARIEQAAMRRIWTEVGIAFTATSSLISYVFFSWSTIWLDLQESSFLQIIRFLISDPDIAFSNLQETGWSVLEAAPIQSILLGLGIILCLICTLGFSLRLREVRHELSLNRT